MAPPTVMPPALRPVQRPACAALASLRRIEDSARRRSRSSTERCLFCFMPGDVPLLAELTAAAHVRDRVDAAALETRPDGAD